MYSQHSIWNAHAPSAPSLAFLNTAQRQRPAKQKCIVIFDWDDTLFPTTTIVFNDNKGVSAGKLRELGEAVYNLLAKYLKTFGAQNVFIVTNGSKSWVLHSLKMISQRYQACFDGTDDEKGRSEDYFAAIYNTLISSNSIPVVSAQDEYKYRYPQQPTLWKTLAFKSIVKAYFNLYSSSDNNIYCIISIGDSEDEFKASFEAKQMISTMNRLNRNNNIARLHRIKLKEEPTINEMVNQMASLMKEAEVLQKEKGSITIRYLQDKTLRKEHDLGIVEMEDVLNRSNPILIQK